MEDIFCLNIDLFSGFNFTKGNLSFFADKNDILIKNIFGTRNSRVLKEYQILVDKTNSLESKYQRFTEPDFIKETELFDKKIFTKTKAHRISSSV